MIIPCDPARSPPNVHYSARLVLIEVQLQHLKYATGLCSALLAFARAQMLACICTTMVMAQSIGAFTLLALVISSGFAIVRNSIPGWWCVQPPAHD